MRRINNRLFAGATGLCVVLAVMALVLTWERYARPSGLPGVLRLVSTPLGDLPSGPQVQARPSPPAVKMAHMPLTGGAMQAKKNLPDEKPEAQSSSPQPLSSDNATVPLPPAAIKPEASPPVLAVGAGATDSKAPDPAPRKEPEPRPVVTSNGLGMQPGVIVANGRQAPELRLAMSSADIQNLVATGNAVIVAENEQSHTVHFLDRLNGSFRPMTEISAATMSDRYVPVTDAGLVAAWRLRLGQLPSVRFNFGLRFTRSFGDAIVERQFASLAEQNIDFNRALADGTKITTHSSVGPGSQIIIDRVSVETSHKTPIE